MADINYSRTLQHEDWIDNEDVVQAGGEKGFNKKFHDVEAEFDKISSVVATINSAITSTQVTDGSVTTAKIADGAVTNTKIASNAIDTDKITANSVRTNHIQDGAISSGKLQNNSVARANIQDGAITLKKLSLQLVGSGIANVGPGQTASAIVTSGQLFPIDTDEIYMPSITVSGPGGLDVNAQIVIAQGADLIGTVIHSVIIRLNNKGNGTAAVSWKVFTFSKA